MLTKRGFFLFAGRFHSYSPLSTLLEFLQSDQLMKDKKTNILSRSFDTQYSWFILETTVDLLSFEELSLDYSREHCISFSKKKKKNWSLEMHVSL
jgi:hypothetical protein